MAGGQGFTLDIEAKTQTAYKRGHADEFTDSSTVEDIRKHFYDNYLFGDYDDFYTKQKFKGGSSIAVIARLLVQGMVTRINSWIKVKNSSNSNSADKNSLIKLEGTHLSEVYGFSVESISIEENSGLTDFLSKIINNDKNSSGSDLVNRFERDIYSRAFGPDIATDRQKKAFSQVFKGSKIEAASQMQERQLSALIFKMESSGLLHLARYADSISEFAKTRLSSVEQTRKSALESINPARDLVWLGELTTVLKKISRDPIALATINVYFPSLITFFFNALTVTADFSNNGKGGGEEDTINDLDDFMDSLEKAFGRTIDFDGNDLKGSIFKLAARYENTAKKMAAVLAASPYRQNSQPKSPDIFHLRLGASNFYVPPLTIDVNTFFKTGSLTGGAIRQKSSPKFSSGHKETSIRMKLFFPNYEEIWGITIDDASKISLNDNYEIDFRKRRLKQRKDR